MEALYRCGAKSGAMMVMLSDLKAKNINPGDKPIGDGTVTGLRLEPGSAKGRGKWNLRFVSPITGKRRDMGLGAYPETSITDARKSAATARELILNGEDPIKARKADKSARKTDAQALTFEKAARQVHAALKPGWQNPRHAANWISSLEMYAFPRIGSRKVKDLKASDFADMLRPIWINKADTASRVKQRCNAVMDWCVAQELIGANPVGVVTRLLAKQAGSRERVVHQPAMPWQKIPDFIESNLRTGQQSLSKMMLEFLILTAARSGEVRAMIWDEVDLEDAVWTVPTERMKAKNAHRVPLSARAVEMLKAKKDKAAHPTLIFPSIRGKVPSDMILTKFLRDHNIESSEPGRTATAHGFRSSFRDWASENGYARDLAERALAHTISNQAEAAYHRTDLLEQRRGMMEAWAQHVCGLGIDGDKVVPIRGGS